MNDSERERTIDLLPIPAAARSIAMSERWLRYQVAAGAIPVVCFGRRRLIRRQDLDRFVASHVRRLPAEDET